MKRIDRKCMVFMSTIYVIALAVRLLKLIIDPLLQRDAALYLSLSEMWQTSGNYSQSIASGTIVPPFPLFIFVKMIDYGFDAEIGGRSVSLVLSSLIPVLGSVISFKLFKNSLITIITTFILIVHPVLLSYSIQPLRENFYLFFWGVTILAAINGIKNKRMKDWGICGLFLSLSFFCRYEALEGLIIYPILIVYLFLMKKINRKNAIVSLIVFFATTFLSSILLLATIDFDLTFIKNISKYSNIEVYLK